MRVKARLVLLEACVGIAAAAGTARGTGSAGRGALCLLLLPFLLLVLLCLFAARLLGRCGRTRGTRLALGLLFALGLLCDSLSRSVLARRVTAAVGRLGGAALTVELLLVLGLVVRDFADDRNANAGQLFDVREVRALRLVAERDRRALLPCSAGAADAVDIGLRNVRQVEIDNERQLADVDAACGDVGRNEHRDLALLEVGERTLTLVLRLVAMDGAREDARSVEVACHAVRAVLGAGKDESLVDVRLVDELGQQRALFGLLNEVDLLLDLLDRTRGRRDRYLDRVLEHAVREVCDFRRNGRGEQQRLALCRQLLYDALDVREKAHVEHSVRLVEHKGFDLVQLYDFLTHEVPQAARGRDEDVRAALDGLDLRHLRHAAEDDRRRYGHITRVLAYILIDLKRKLTRRSENERTDAASGVLVEPLDDRHGKRAGLARAGLRTAEQVASLENRRDGLLLNGGRLLIAGLGQRLENVSIEFQFFEFHKNLSFPS